MGIEMSSRKLCLLDAARLLVKEKKSVFSSRASLGITAISTILQGGVPGPEVVG